MLNKKEDYGIKDEGLWQSLLKIIIRESDIESEVEDKLSSALSKEEYCTCQHQCQININTENDVNYCNCPNEWIFN